MSEMSEIKALIEQQGQTWEQYKKANDDLLKAKADGGAVDELKSQLAKMDSALNENSKELKDLVLKAQRPQVSNNEAHQAAKDLKSFNARVQAAAMEAGRSFAAVSADDYAAYKSAMDNLLRKGIENLSEAEKKAINVGTSTMGGFLTGVEMEAGIDRVVRRYSAMRQLATVRSIGQASYKKLVKVSGTAGATRGGENTAPTNGDGPRWVELEFKAGTYLSEQRITSEALEDITQDIGADLEEEIGIELAELEGVDFINGDGVNGPRGIHSYDIVANASHSWGKVGYIASGASASFAASNPSDRLIDLVHSLKRQYRAGAAWSMNDATLAAIRKFKDGQGNYLWGMTAPSNLMEGAVGTLLGYPVVTDDFMPDLGANALPIAFGDFKRAYYVVDRKGLAILRDPVTAFPHVRFLARRRVGGGIANFEAIKLLKCEN